MKILTLSALVALSLLMMSCGKYYKGNPNIINEELTDRIQVNKTTKQDIIDWFGTDGRKGFMDGKEILYFEYLDYSSSSVTLFRTLEVRFNPKTKKVVEYRAK